MLIAAIAASLSIRRRGSQLTRHASPGSRLTSSAVWRVQVLRISLSVMVSAIRLTVPGRAP